MKLTTKSEYTILALIYMARLASHGQVLVKMEEICNKYIIDKKYLEQLFSILKRNGIIRAKRGASGGYQLTRPASQISIAQIVRLMDGPLASTESVSKYFFNYTPLGKEKKVLKVFKDIRNYIDSRLEKAKLSDFI